MSSERTSAVSREGHDGKVILREVRPEDFSALAAMRRDAEMLVDYATLDLGLAKMQSEIRADNEAALKMNYAVGFRPVGTMHAHFRDVDATYDVILLERLLNDVRP